MSSGGDGIYCRVFIVRERREALSSHLALAWKGTRNLSDPSQGGSGGWTGWPQTLQGPSMRAPSRPIPPPLPAPARVAFGSVCHLTHSKSGVLNCTSRIFQGT